MFRGWTKAIPAMRFLAVAFKNVWRRRIRSALTCIGVSLAIATAVSLIGFANGLEKSSLEAYGAHGVDMVVLRSGVSERLTSNLDERIADRLAALPGVRAVNPSLTDLVSFGDGRLIGIPMHGWPTDRFALESLHVIAGRCVTDRDRGAVMLGQGLAAGLNKQVGDEVEIESHEFRIVGVYEGANLLENSTAVMALAELQNLMDRPRQVTEFQIQVNDNLGDARHAVERLRPQITALASAEGKPLGLAAMATEEYVTGSTEVRLAHGMAVATSLIALLISSIGVLNTMIMSVLERTQEIGALRAIGWRKSRVLRMILGESSLLSAAGGCLGIVVAWPCMILLSRVRAIEGFIRPELSASAIGQGLLLTVILAIAGGLYPAYRGMRVAPSEALRYE
jgi:putative ABC transport system permease protein